ncbi:cysteine--tRNA ligase, partial [Candidatus Woesearchaeota archaeon]|nr:cysteine--tRNA ligase [Candidatus Woesearchaeota archaeon]
VDGHKMSKSLGNFYTLRDLLNKGYNPKAIRYLLLSANYRDQLNFTEEAVKAADNAVQRLNDFMIKLREISAKKFPPTSQDKKNSEEIFLLLEKSKKEFEEAMDDDLSISISLSHIFEFVKEANTLMMANKIGKDYAKKIINLMKDFDNVLGILEEKEEKLSPELKKLIDEREKARKEKNYEKADKIRQQLREKRIILEDTKWGVRWKKVN